MIGICEVMTLLIVNRFAGSEKSRWFRFMIEYDNTVTTP